MGYQFLHVEGYARSAGKGKTGGHNLSTIVGEAERQKGACPHVESPLPPVILFGEMPTQAVVDAQTWAEQAVDGRGHKIRKDGLCLLAGVISAAEDMQGWPEYKNATTDFLRGFYGDRLKSVIEHVDEKERHLHFYAVPHPGERFETLHPGRAAAAQIKAAGGLKGEQNKAYKEAMRGWQTLFWEQVSSRFGLNKLGPRRRRLTRAEWKAEKSVAELIQCEMEKAEANAAKAEASESEIRRLQAELAAIKKELATAKNPPPASIETQKTKQFLEGFHPSVERTYQERLERLRKDETEEKGKQKPPTSSGPCPGGG